MVRARGLYWAGRTAQLAGDAQAAVTHYLAARAVEPLHYYALIAGARLRELGQSVADAFTTQDASAPIASQTQAPLALASTSSTSTSTTADPPAPGAPKPKTQLTLPDDAQLFLRLGLLDDAMRAIQAAESNLRNAAEASGDGLVPLLSLYASLDQHARAYRLAERERGKTLFVSPAGSERALWDALFPRPYTSIVASAAAQEQLPESFLYSIMRKESAFDPRVVSYADAIGLMQLLERTAKLVARGMGQSELARENLFQPEINVALGARYLKNLRSRYQGRFAPTIAAYNAGEHRVDQWLERSRAKLPKGTELELDRFVEEIPIEQTHNYVRRVLANWARYRYLEGQAEGDELPVPMSL